ncbi:hypothetical protein CGMCC3_g5696 [Colletotrichum fructicola]|nr:uncharacterized protein CGMCC3_g5696 [Colletotrichum fructicola]KAE9578291.1 hypothetical protein CGMCC3_g5696 [Colletotrichum fructicola]
MDNEERPFRRQNRKASKPGIPKRMGSQRASRAPQVTDVFFEQLEVKDETDVGLFGRTGRHAMRNQEPEAHPTISDVLVSRPFQTHASQAFASSPCDRAALSPANPASPRSLPPQAHPQDIQPSAPLLSMLRSWA